MKESEFKLFNLIEDTISDVLEFSWVFLKTIIVLIYKPKLVLIDTRNQLYTKPYSFLTFSLIFFVFCYLAVDAKLFLNNYEINKELTEIAFEQATEVSFESMLGKVFPSIIYLFIIASIFGLGDKERTKGALLCTSYVAGLLSILLGASIIVIIYYGAENAGHAIYENALLLLIINTASFVLSSRIAYIYWVKVICHTHDNVSSYKATIKAISLSLGMTCLLGLCLLLGVESPKIIRELSNNEKLVTYMVDAELSNSQMEMTLILENRNPKAAVIQRKKWKATSQVFYSTGLFRDLKAGEKEEVNIKFKAWSANGSPVLIIDNGNIAWVTLIIDLPKFKDSEFGINSIKYDLAAYDSKNIPIESSIEVDMQKMYRKLLNQSKQFKQN
jgi:hypothetical protein